MQKITAKFFCLFSSICSFIDSYSVWLQTVSVFWNFDRPMHKKSQYLWNHKNLKQQRCEKKRKAKKQPNVKLSYYCSRDQLVRGLFTLPAPPEQMCCTFLFCSLTFSTHQRGWQTTEASLISMSLPHCYQRTPQYLQSDSFLYFWNISPRTFCSFSERHIIDSNTSFSRNGGAFLSAKSEQSFLIK